MRLLALLALLLLGQSLALKTPKYDVPQLPLWPYPSTVIAADTATVLTVDPSLTFSCIGASCSSPDSVLADAFSRYTKYVLWAGKKDSPSGTVKQVQVNASSVPTLALGVDESYSLVIGASGSVVSITAPTEWGALHALETLSQLVLWNATNSAYYITNVPITIQDAPRFQWRSVLIDSSRHFLPVKTVLHTIDALSYNKFNVLHWHLSDDQSFPFFSASFPSLSGLGAYSPRAVYSPSDIAAVIEYARLRGVRVVPEFDTPGHTGSWAAAWPSVFLPCGEYALMNPTQPALYALLTTFFTEVAKRFPDAYVHLGGDEVDLLCWAANANVTRWLAAHNTSNIADVQAYHEEQVVAINAALGRQSIGWEEVFRNQGSVYSLPKSIIVDVWETGTPTLVNAVKAGYRALWSFGYYLDQQIPNPAKTFYLWLDTWMDFYLNDPVAGSGLTPAEEALVLGGGSSQWGEQVDSTCIDERMWPRASATAERLWSPAYVNDTDDALARLIAFRCHMVRRGVNASPIRPDWCELGPLGVL